MAALVVFSGCAVEAEPRARGEKGSASVRRTESAQGTFGLEIAVTGPESVGGGQPFEISYDISDDEGELRGTLIEWGDDKVSGGMPMDLVCSATAGQPQPTEKATTETESLEHAYRAAGTYEISLTASTGGCFTTSDEATVVFQVEVIGAGDVSNGPLVPKAEIGHAYYMDGDPSVLVSDIGGYDEDGFVDRIEIDWGDGLTETMEQPVSKCEESRGGWPGGWFSRPTEHAYEEPGEYQVTIEVTSVGCDDRTAQRASAQRVLEFPPEQGS